MPINPIEPRFYQPIEQPQQPAPPQQFADEQAQEQDTDQEQQMTAPEVEESSPQDQVQDQEKRD